MSSEQKDEFRFMLTYGIGFITLMFLGFLSGFMVGYHLLKLSYEHSLILSLVVGTATMFLEGVLLILRMQKLEGKQNSKTKSKNKAQREMAKMELNIMKNQNKIVAKDGKAKLKPTKVEPLEFAPGDLVTKSDLAKKND